MTLLFGKVEYFISWTSNTCIVQDQWFLNRAGSDSSLGRGLADLEIGLEKLIRLLKDNIFVFGVGNIDDGEALLLARHVFLVFFTILTVFADGVEVRSYLWTLLNWISDILS